MSYPVDLQVVAPVTGCLPLPDPFFFIPNCGQYYNNARAIQIASIICTNTAINVAKLDKLPMHAGPCAFGLTGFVTGHCGQNGGRLEGVYVGSFEQLYFMSVHFSSTIGASTGGTMVATGHVRKISGDGGQTGLIVITVDSTPPTPLVTTSQSCLAGTAFHWTITGTVTLATV